MLIWRAFRLIFRNALCTKYGKAVRLRQNLFLKWLLIVQSFSPLFVLLLVKYIKKDVSKLVFKFINLIVDGNISAAIPSAFFHEEILRVTICLFCTILILFGGWIYYYFKGRELAGFIDRAEKISINGDTTEMSIVFFATYVIPMVMDDITNIRGFVCFVIVISMLILLMRNTNLYYQNPILAILGYKTFQFTFLETGDETLKNKNCIGITRGKFDSSKIIKWKYISDNVFLVYNKN